MIWKKIVEDPPIFDFCGQQIKCLFSTKVGPPIYGLVDNFTDDKSLRWMVLDVLNNSAQELEPHICKLMVYWMEIPPIPKTKT